MTQTAEAKLVELAKAYSKHRKALRDNEKARKSVISDCDTLGFVDLKPFRNRYMSGEVTDDPDCSIVWHGWLHAVDTCQAWDGQELEDDNIYRSMAKLLDERKEINAQGARIRNRLRIIGDQLLRAEP
jgi:hypothetical protein